MNQTVNPEADSRSHPESNTPSTTHPVTPDSDDGFGEQRLSAATHIPRYAPFIKHNGMNVPIVDIRDASLGIGLPRFQTSAPWPLPSLMDIFVGSEYTLE